MATRTLSNSNTQLMNNELNHASRMLPKTGCDRDGERGQEIQKAEKPAEEQKSS